MSSRQALFRRLTRESQRVQALESVLRTGQPRKTRHRRRPHFIDHVRLTTLLEPGGTAKGQFVRWNMGQSCWMPIGSGEITVRDTLARTLACPCDVIPITRQIANEAWPYLGRRGPVSGVAAAAGLCGSTIPVRVCGEGTCACSGSDACSGSESGSLSGSVEVPTTCICQTAESTVFAEVVEYPVFPGERVLLFVAPGGQILALRDCTTACEGSGSGEGCVVFETDARCEGNRICIYKRAKELIAVGTRIICTGVTDWVFQHCCDIPCCDSGSLSSVDSLSSGSVSDSGVEPLCCECCSPVFEFCALNGCVGADFLTPPDPICFDTEYRIWFDGAHLPATSQDWYLTVNAGQIQITDVFPAGGVVTGAGTSSASVKWSDNPPYNGDRFYVQFIVDSPNPQTDPPTCIHPLEMGAGPAQFLPLQAGWVYLRCYCGPGEFNDAFDTGFTI